MADETIRKLQELYGVDNDLALSLELGLNRSTVAQWRKRGSVPSRFQLLLDVLREQQRRDDLVLGGLSRAYAAKVAARLYGAADASNWFQVGLALLPAEALELEVEGAGRGRFLEAALLTIIGFAMQAARVEFGDSECKTRGDVLRIIETMQSDKYRAGVRDIALGAHKRQLKQAQ